MRVLHYCQHVLGLGHFFRSLAVAGAMAPHPVTLVCGGPPPDVPIPGHIRYVQLPALVMDEHFRNLRPDEPGRDLEEVKDLRRAALLDLFRSFRPDAFLVELFPFGRKAFRFELLPALQAVKAGEFGPVATAVSLRDILVDKDDGGKHEARALDICNRFFDAVFVHADPALARLEETFGRTADLLPPVQYTGYVVRPVQPGPAARLGLDPEERIIVAAAGGGKVGAPLLAAALDAFALLRKRLPARLLLFTGPFLDDAAFADLERKARRVPGAAVSRFSARYPELLASADLSVSMAGYNTTMDLLAANVRALVLPFDQNREQRTRAERLARMGALEVLADTDLDPARLARRMEKTLTGPKPGPSPVRLDGAETTARLLERLVGGTPPAAGEAAPPRTPASSGGRGTAGSRPSRPRRKGGM